ncbi:TRAP transporter small permease [Pseudodesulfovibrio tunisiensis]|uniref:TRAP transporter small permease n=1 Tax=Pseudodesulfovibrio tunisiensis TaxID=463192 RepID=UPI001FB29E56|nr:TRAP transporter small permease [Pseudodesulfovibrio tunisiensis]
MQTLIIILGRLETVMKIVAACCLMGMALVTGADVLGRGAMNTPLFGSEEIVTILAVLVMGMALPYAHSQGSHIGVEVVMRRFSRKVRARVKCFTDLCACVLFGIVAWRMALYAASLERSGQVSMNLELPTYWVVHALAFGFLAFSLCLLKDTLIFFTKESR